MVRTVKKPAERRQEIIAAARELFQEKEYEKTTMRDVMERLDIAKGTIYHYFKSKEELLEAVVEQSVDEYLSGLQSLLENTPGSALQRLQVLIRAGNVAEEHGEIMAHLHRPGNIGLHTRQLAATIQRLAPLYAGVIQQGRDEGAFQCDHPLECAEFLLAGTQFLTDVGFYPWEPADLLRRAQAIPALLEAQLHAPRGSFDFLLEQL